jgi:hypothetical protein
MFYNLLKNTSFKGIGIFHSSPIMTNLRPFEFTLHENCFSNHGSSYGLALANEMIEERGASITVSATPKILFRQGKVLKYMES